MSVSNSKGREKRRLQQTIKTSSIEENVNSLLDRKIDTIGEEKYFFTENNRFSEVVRFSHYDSGDKKSKSIIGFLSIRVRNSGGAPFDKYLNKYLRELRRKHFLSAFYIVSESETTPYSDHLRGRVPNSFRKELSYRIESLRRGQIQISERIILIDSKVYHIEYCLSKHRLFPVIYNMINSIYFKLSSRSQTTT